MITKEELIQQMAARNTRSGNLDPDIYDCKLCKNRGYWWEITAKKKTMADGKEINYMNYETLVECPCINLRRQKIANKHGVDINAVNIKYGDRDGCDHKGFDYSSLWR